MKLPRFLRQLFDAEERSAPPADPFFWMSPRLMGGSDLADPLEHAWVYSVVNRIVDQAGSVPLRLYQTAGKEQREITSGPWVDFFEDPNPDMTPGDFWSISRQHVLLPPGECFWVLTDARGSPVARNALPRYAFPCSGKDFEEVVGENGLLVGWKHRIGKRIIERALWEVVHFRFPHKDRPHRGMSPYEAAKRSVRTDVKAGVRNESLLDNDATPSGILSTKEGSVDISAAQLRQIRQVWEDRHQGVGKAGRPAVLSNLEWQQIGLSPRDMDHQKLREWVRMEVCAAYGVPLFLVSVLGDVHRETSREALKLFWTGCIIPKLAREQETIRRDLFLRHGGEDVSLVWDISGVQALRREAKERAETAAILWKSGVSMQELNRAFELGLEEQPGWEVPFVPIGVQPAEFAAMEDEMIPPAQKGMPMIAGGERGSDDRYRKWRAYVNGVQAPGERRYKRRYLRWVRKIRRETMKWLESRRSQRALTESGVEAFLAENLAKWEKALAKETKPPIDWIVKASVEALDEQLGGLTVVETGHPRILDFVNEHTARGSKQITGAVQKQLRLTMLQGLGEGETLAEMQERVRVTMNVTAHKAQAVARTESGAASNGADFEVYGLEGITEHTWLSAGDGEERETHKHLDGVTISVGAEFSNGLRYPLDTRGEAKEVVNCRCTTTPEV